MTQNIFKNLIFPSGSDNVQCAACECIRYQFSMRLSPSGSSLYVPLILTCFSHCCFCLQLFFYMLIIIKVAFGNVNVKFALPTTSACRRLYGGFSCPERLFRSVHALSVFRKEPFLKFPSFSQPAVYFHALSVILPE